jgi:hypothetical protein
MPGKSNKTKSDIEWENRTLCSDESCIGVIGPDGRCKECGKPYEGKLEWTPSETEAIEIDEPNAVEEADDSDDSSRDQEWENRTLCSDESCIGVIGPDGRCKECGKPFK